MRNVLHNVEAKDHLLKGTSSHKNLVTGMHVVVLNSLAVTCLLSHEITS